MSERENKDSSLFVLVLVAVAFAVKDYFIPVVTFILQGSSESSKYSYLSAMFQFLVYILVFFVYELRRNNLRYRSPENQMAKSKQVDVPLKDMVVAVGVSILSFIAFQLMKTMVLLILYAATQNSIWIPEITVVNARSLLLIFLVHVVCSAIAEETFYRGVLLRELSKGSPKFALLVVILLFAFAHSSIEQVIQSLFLGTVLCLVFARKGSLLLCTVIHIVYNTLGWVNTYLYAPGYGMISDVVYFGTSLDCYKNAVLLAMFSVVIIGGLLLLLPLIERQEGATSNNRFQNPKLVFLGATILLVIYARKCILTVWQQVVFG